MTLRCAVYARFSAEMQSARSVDDQERECRAFAERHGWDVVLVERDAAVRAGAVASRTGYQRLLEAATRRELDVVLVEEVSRFSRDFLGGFMQLAELKKHGVKLADTRSGIVDLDSPEGQIRIALNLSTSQGETQRLGERSKRGLKGKVLSKFSAGGQPAYGYQRKPIYSAMLVDIDGNPKREGVRLERHATEAPFVEKIFEMYRDGHSKHGIANELNRLGVPTRRAGSVKNGVAVSGAWTASGIKSVLENRLYTGRREWNRTSRRGEKLPTTGKKRQLKNDVADLVVVDDYADRIIDGELFEVVASRLASDAAKYRQNKVARNDQKYLLSGLVTCAFCGARFVIGAHKGRPRVPHYRCGRRSTSGNVVCTNKVTVPQPALEERVRRVLDVVMKDPVQLEALVREHNRRISKVNEGQLHTVRLHEEQLAALEAQQARLVEAVKLGAGKVAVLVEELSRLDHQLGAARARVEESRRLVQPLLMPRPGAVAQYLAGGKSLFEDDLVAQRELLQRVLRWVLVYPDGALLLEFNEATLFEPVRHVRLRADAPTTPSELGNDRRAWTEAFEEMRRAAADASGKATPDLEVDVFEQADGRPAYVVMSRGVVGRRFGGLPKPGETSKMTLASPAGFEPA